MPKRTSSYRARLLQSLTNPIEAIHYINAALGDSPEMLLKAMRNAKDANSVSSETRIGPNVKRLLFTKMAKDAIPDGGGLASGIQFLSSKENISAGFKSARDWTEQAIQLVRTAAEPNPWKHASDEEIAGELLKRLDERAG